MPAWLGITLAIAAPILSFVGTLMAVSFMMGGRIMKIETTQDAHSRALEVLPDTLRAFVSKEEGKGYQAQLDRLEKADAECEGRMTGQRQELGDRMERLGARLAAHEQTQSAQNTALTAALTRLEATMEGMKDAINRLASAPAQQPPQVQGDFLQQLQQFVQLQKMLKGAA